MSIIDRIKSLKLESNQFAIFWLGQNSYIIKITPRTSIAIDPYLSRDKEHRYVHSKPPVEPEDLKVDYIFCTHDHGDHTDPTALPIIAKNYLETIFLGPRESCEHLADLGINRDRLITLEVNRPYVTEDFTATAYYSILPEKADTTHFGYLFQIKNSKIYNMGDSSREIAKEPEVLLNPIKEASPDIAIVPIIGDVKGRIPEDAYIVTKFIKPKIVIPCHYDCFADRTIDPKEFVRLLKRNPDIKPVVIQYKGFYMYGGSVKSSVAGLD